MSAEPKDLLKGLDTETIQDLFLKEHPDERGNKLNKNSMVSTLAKSVEEAGIKSLLANLKREDLSALATNAQIPLEKSEKNNKTVLSKRLTAALSESNIHDFLSEYAEEPLLLAICAAVDYEPESEKKKDLVDGITHTVRTLGLESFFSSFDVDQLQDVAEDLKLKTGKTSNKRKLVESIIFKKDVEKEVKPKKRRTEASKKKKPIEKGITYEDIFQHYYLGEVRQYCKDNGLKTAGKKSALIKRILAYLDGDESAKSLPPGKRAKKGRKKKVTKKASDGEKKGSEASDDESK